MNIEDINKMSDEIFISSFKNIFEKTPLLAKLSLLHKPFKDKSHVIDTFIHQFENLDSTSKKKIINNHPDLGDKIKINHI